MSEKIRKMQWLAQQAEQNGNPGLAFDLRCKISAMLLRYNPNISKIAENIESACQEGDIQY